MQMEKSIKPYKLGLALSGGGAKGFAHLGVFELLDECHLKPDIISGTSAGSIMGAFYADGYSPREIMELFSGREFFEFAQLQIPKSGLFDTSRFRNFLKTYLRAKRIEELQIPLVIVATDLDHGLSKEVREGPLVPHRYKQTLFHIAERSYHYMFQANTMEDRELCDVLIEAKEFGLYKTFDLENVKLISQIGYEAAREAFRKVVEENKFQPLVNAIKGANRSLAE